MTFGRYFVLLLFLAPVLMGKAQPQPYYAFDNLDGMTQHVCVRSMAQSADGMMWLATERGLYSYDGYHVINRSMGNEVVDSLKVGSFNHLLAVDDSLIIGCEKGLLSFDLKTHRFRSLAYVEGEMVKGMARIGSTLWVATHTALYKDGQIHSPSPANIISLYSDEQRLYIGTMNAVYRYSPQTQQLETITDDVTYAACFLYDPHNHYLWIGTASYVMVWDIRAMKSVFTIKVPVAKSLTTDQYGNTLIGTDNGLFLVEKNRWVRSVSHDARRENSLAGDAVWSLYRDRSNTIWIGTNSGVSVVPGDGWMTTYTLPSITGEGTGNQFFCVYRDSKERLWLGGSNGLLCLEHLGAENQTYRWYRMNDARYPIRHNRIRVITETSKGSLLVGGDMGLMRYDEVSQQFQRFVIEEDPYNWVYGIRESGNGDFVLTTFTATYLVALDETSPRVSVTSTLPREVLPANEDIVHDLLARYGLSGKYLSAYDDTRGGMVLLGGTDRFSVLDTKKLNKARSNRSLAITDIRINGERYIDREALLRGKLVLLPGDRIVEVLFSDYVYSGEASHHFLYRLDEGAWTPVHSDNNTITLTHLTPGRYTLYLRFSDATTEALSLEIKVKAPWYASTGAKVLYIVVICCLIYGVYFTIRQRKRIKQEQVEHDAQLLKAKQKENELLSDNEYLASQLRLQLLAKAGEEGVLSDDEKILLKLTKLIEENLSDTELNVNTLSELSGISSKQLYRKIKALTGMTAVAYIRDQRLKKAASLLAKGTFTVSEVMYMVGFSNASYFARCFAEAYKTLPSEYKG